MAKGGLKTVVSIAAAVAIPYAAPALSSSLGLTAAIGATAGSAAVGAGLGGAAAAVTGQSVTRGALLGGLAGGAGGYLSTPAAPTPTALTPTPGGLDVSGAFLGDLNTAAMPSTALSVAPQSALGGIGNAFATGVTSMPTAPISIDPAAGLTAPTGTTPTFMDALRNVPTAIANKFSDPNALADLTLRAAGMLAGSVIASEGLSPEEQQLVDARAAELKDLQATNRALFDQQLQAAQQLIGEARYFDPEYFGLQSARRVQVAAGRAKTAGLRGLSGERRKAEARRYDLETGRNVGTAYDVGYQTGVSGRMDTLQAGLAAMPGYLTEATGSPYSVQMDARTAAANRAASQRRDIGSLFGDLAGRSY